MWRDRFVIVDEFLYIIPNVPERYDWYLRWKEVEETLCQASLPIPYAALFSNVFQNSGLIRGESLWSRIDEMRLYVNAIQLERGSLALHEVCRVKRMVEQSIAFVLERQDSELDEDEFVNVASWVCSYPDNANELKEITAGDLRCSLLNGSCEQKRCMFLMRNGALKEV